MYEMKFDDGQPLLRNGTRTWCKPIVDESGNFFASQQDACATFNLSPGQVSRAVLHGVVLSSGKTFRLAEVAEVHANLGDQVSLVGSAKKTLAKKKAATKAKKPVKTIEIDSELEHLERDMPLFEGHEFTGGPAVMRMPGFPAWSMERPTKDDFPPELRDNCRWS